MLKIFFHIFVGILWSASAFGQGGPLGGSVQSIVIDPANPANIYIGTATGGAFKSTNSGATWNSITTSNFSRFVIDLAIDPVQTSTVYAATRGPNGGVLKSVDGAITWALANDGIGTTNLTALALDSMNPSTIYAGTSATGVFKSTNGASTWAPINSGLTNLAIQCVTIDPSNSSNVYAGTAGGVFKSINGGATWSAINSGLADLFVLALAVDPKNPGILYAGTNSAGTFKSINGGATWAAANSGLTPSTPSVRHFSIDRDNTNVVYAATFGGVFKSINGAVTWIAVNSGIRILSGSGVPGGFRVVIDQSNPSTVYVGTQSEGGVFKTTNGGASWNALNAGLTAAQISAIAIDRFNPATVYAATTSNAVYKSTNGGLSWFEANLGFSTLIILSLAIDPNTTTTIYAGTRNRGGGEGIFKTVNGGASWSRMGFGVSSPVEAIGINPGNPSVVYAGTFGSGLFKSTNGGGAWAPVNSGLLDLDVQSLAIDPLNPSTLYAGTDNGLFKSTDSGASWAPFNSGLTNTNVLAVAINPFTTSTLYAGTNSGLFKSTNGGASWTLASSGISTPRIIHAIVIDPTNPSTLYAGKASLGLVFKSIDGGQTWNDVSSGLPSFPTFLSALAIDPSSTATLYAGTDSSGIFKSTVGGGTWQPTGSPAPVCTFSLSPSGLSFGPEGGLGSFMVNTDGACNWNISQDANWFRPLPSVSKGPTTINYAVASNSGGSRAGTISVGGQRHRVDQQALTCTLTISPSFTSIASTGGIVNVSVNAPRLCSWTAFSNAPWITVASGRSGSGGGVVVLNVASNASGSRSGSVTIAGQTFTVNQGAGACGAMDITPMTRVTSSGLTFIYPSSYLYSSTITVTNSSSTPLSSVYLVLLGMPRHRPFPYDAGLLGNQVLTTCFSAQGDYLLLVSASLQPGQRVGIPVVWFTQSPGISINYTARVFSGRPSH